ncbi:hypothetical protein [Kutzneria chonburiensis]|uniref:Uncharacterized protein n=1 Tax=Kutzneria chonburiensis TaxID=1483604 RepID=A0ABV6N2U6_9PSEU|nr:hypothetical protein [Kutzneria chonburiensis]
MDTSRSSSSSPPSADPATWSAAELVAEAGACLARRVRHTAAETLLRGIGLAILARYRQHEATAAAVRDALADAKAAK